MERKAKERQRLSEGPGQKGTQKSAGVKRGESRDELAGIAGISHDTLKRAEVPSNLRPVALAHRIGCGIFNLVVI